MWQRLHSPLQKKKPPRAYSPQTVLYQSVPLPRMRLPLFPFPPRRPFHRQDPPTPRLAQRFDDSIEVPTLLGGGRPACPECPSRETFPLLSSRLASPEAS